MGQEARTEQAMQSSSGLAPTFAHTPEELIRRLRYTLTGSFAALRQPTEATETPLSTGEAAYIAAALDVLEQLATSAVPAAPLQVVPVELADMLMALLAQWKTAAPRHSLELALPGDSPTVMADQQTVTQVAHLLLAAAIQLAPRGSAVRVSLRTQDDGALIGIRQFETLLAEERLNEIFEPFAMMPELDAERMTALVPLAVARRLVESHSGRIWAEATTRATGMTFYVWWPHTPTLRPEPGPSFTEQPPAPQRLPLTRQEPVVLIIEGDTRMARYLRANVEAHGYQAHTCECEEDAFKYIDREEPDLLLLDSSLSAMEGTSLLARLRQYASAPILMLGRSADPRTCARLLDAGAMDYIPRPFNIEELMARIRAALRASQVMPAATTRSGLVTVGTLEIDLAHQQVHESGRPIALSRTEYRLLRALAQHPGMVISHSQLLERVWGAGYGQETEFLWVYVRRLRRKIEPDPAHPHYILTAPGVGYQLAESPIPAAELSHA